MKVTLVVLASICVLSLLSCSKANDSSNLEKLPSELLRIIAIYLENPFLNLGSLSHHFIIVFSKDLPVKFFIKKRFNIPELIDGDVDDNERELKFILSFSRYKSPDHIYQVLRHNFLNRNKFDKLVPQLMKYFGRMYPERRSGSEEEMYAIIEHKKFSYFFQSNPPLFNVNASWILEDVKRTKDLQEYMLSHPDHFEYIQKYFESIAYTENNGLIRRWIITALATNMPDSFIFGFIDNNVLITSLNSMPSLWKEIFVPRMFYLDLYKKLNIMINDLSDEKDADFYRVLNLIRFGPEVHDVYETQIKPKFFSNEQLLLLCHCASLANKMDVFSKLLPEIMPEIVKDPFLVDQKFVYDQNNMLFELHKFIIDVHEHANQSLRYFLCDRTQTRFFTILSRNCRIASIKWGKNEIEIEFNISTGAVNQGFPMKVNFGLKSVPRGLLLNFLQNIPEIVEFESTEIFKRFLSDIMTEVSMSEFPINSGNLKLIIKSESLLKHIPRNWKLDVKLSNLLDVVNEPVVSLKGILQVRTNGKDNLTNFKTTEQLERLETLTGFSVNLMLYPESDYFKEQHAFKYLIETGQDLPKNISERTRELLKIDYPLIKP